VCEVVALVLSLNYEMLHIYIEQVSGGDGEALSKWVLKSCKVIWL